MSAYIVAKPHIDALVRVALEGPGGHSRPRSPWSPLCWYHQEARRDVRDTLNRTGRMLWLENYASVAYRYQDSASEGLPGPVDLELEDIKAYACPRILTGPRLTAVEAFKAIRCYAYQACERPEWEDSEAKAFCDELTQSLIASLPGYDEAAWEID